MWLLRRVAGLADAPADELRELLVDSREDLFAPGTTVVAEGEEGRVLHVIAAGVAELTTEVAGARMFLGLLETGDVVGELALVADDHRHGATLTALTELRVLSLAIADVEQFLAGHPAHHSSLQARADALRTADFIRQVAALGALGREERQQLATRVSHRHLARGEVVIRQGDEAGSCYMLQSGAVEVSVDERVVATLEPGALFGEGAVLTSGYRTATVRATEACEVLELAHEDFVDVLQSDVEIAQEIAYLFRLRQRPRRAPGVEVEEHDDDLGETLTTLHNPVALTYFRLSERGRFIWDRLDGRRSLRDLAKDHFDAFGRFDPHAVADVVAALGRACMLDDERFASTPAPRSAASVAARRLLVRRRDVRGADRLAGALHDRGGRLLFTRPGIVAAGTLAAAGVVAFVAALARGDGFGGSPVVFVLLAVAGLWLAMLAHAAGQALAVKAHGRDIRGAGIGWYWLMPLAYVDTSAMWLADGREQRAVGVAGIVAMLVVAAPLAVASLVASSPALWALALPFYVCSLVRALGHAARDL